MLRDCLCFAVVCAELSKENVAQDLESFAKHAGRSTITTDDVLLITRRNDALHDIMKDFVDKEKAVTGKGSKRR
jgi:centromere protein S